MPSRIELVESINQAIAEIAIHVFDYKDERVMSELDDILWSYVDILSEDAND